MAKAPWKNNELLAAKRRHVDSKECVRIRDLRERKGNKLSF